LAFFQGWRLRQARNVVRVTVVMMLMVLLSNLPILASNGAADLPRLSAED
jgi:hypothetical protein